MASEAGTSPYEVDKICQDWHCGVTEGGGRRGEEEQEGLVLLIITTYFPVQLSLQKLSGDITQWLSCRLRGWQYEARYRRK